MTYLLKFVFFLRHYVISRQHLSCNISDEELDRHLRRLTAGNPLLGQHNVLGLLAAEGHTVQRDRVAASLARVEPAAVVMRWSRTTIQRRSHSVAGPNALCHIVGNHKIISFCCCIFGAERRINPCWSLALDDITLNMFWMEKVKICNK